MPVCPVCRSQNMENAKFCGNCGNPFPRTAETTSSLRKCEQGHIYSAVYHACPYCPAVMTSPGNPTQAQTGGFAGSFDPADLVTKIEDAPSFVDLNGSIPVPAAAAESSEFATRLEMPAFNPEPAPASVQPVAPADLATRLETPIPGEFAARNEFSTRIEGFPSIAPSMAFTQEELNAGAKSFATRIEAVPDFSSASDEPSFATRLDEPSPFANSVGLTPPPVAAAVETPVSPAGLPVVPAPLPPTEILSNVPPSSVFAPPPPSRPLNAPPAPPAVPAAPPLVARLQTPVPNLPLHEPTEAVGIDANRHTSMMSADEVKRALGNKGKLVGWLVTYSANPDGDDFRLRAGYNRLGANPACDILIEDETVSGSHAIIVYREGKCFIKDDLSRNGTFVNGKEVTEAYPLQSYNQIRLGNTIMLYVAAQKP